MLALEIAAALAAMEEEDIWSGPVTKAARKAEKKAEQDLWQALESLDLKNAREAAKEVTKKEFFKRRGGGKTPNKLRNTESPSPKHQPRYHGSGQQKESKIQKSGTYSSLREVLSYPICGGEETAAGAGSQN